MLEKCFDRTVTAIFYLAENNLVFRWMSNTSYKAGSGNFLGLIKLVPNLIQFLRLC